MALSHTDEQCVNVYTGLANLCFGRPQGEFEAQLQAFPYPCCAIDSSGHISKWNGSAEKRTGFRQEELVDAPFDTLVDPDDRAKILSALDEAEFNKLDIEYNEVRNVLLAPTPSHPFCSFIARSH